MYILAIETTGAFASVALARANDEAGGSAGAAEGFEILAYAQGHDRYSHLQNLTPQIQQVICDAGITVDDLSAIAVANGPGSFTGIRIGVSTTRAISQIKDIPCIPVSSLEALALRAPAIRETAEPSARKNILVCPILDARRSQVYGAGYLDGEEVVPAGPYTIDEFMELVSDYSEVYMLGDGVDTCGEKIRELRKSGVAFAPEEIRYQRAEEVAVIGAAKFMAGCGVTFDQLKPAYMRMAEAERKLRAKQAESRQAEGREKSNG